MLFHKASKKIDKYKELKCFRFDLFNSLICLNQKDADFFKEKCNKIGYKFLTYEDSFSLLKKNKENEFLNVIHLRERNKKQTIRIPEKDNNIREENNYLNKKRKKKNNKKKELKLKNNSKYIVIDKNSEEYLKGNVIPIAEIYKMMKFIHDKMKTKREKKIIPDKIKLSLDEMRTLKLNLKKKIQNLSLNQIKEINNKYFNTNSENDKIDINLNQLSQEVLKRLQIDIEELEDLNKYNPNFINYKEELRRRIPDNQKVSQFKIFSQDNDNHDSEFTDSDSESDDDDDNLSEKSDFQKKFIDNLENNQNYENLIENFDFFNEESIKNFSEGLNERFENLIEDEKDNFHINSIPKENNKSDENLIKKENYNSDSNLIQNEKDNNIYENLIDDENNNPYFIKKECFNDNFNKNLKENDNASVNQSIINLNEYDDDNDTFNHFSKKKNSNKNIKKNTNKNTNLKNVNNKNLNNNINNHLNENDINYIISDEETISQD